MFNLGDRVVAVRGPYKGLTGTVVNPKHISKKGVTRVDLDNGQPIACEEGEVELVKEADNG